MSFSVEQECPQCGGAIELDEADHLIKCPYCNVNSFVSNPEHFRFVLPHNGNPDQLIFVPYIRFRGSALTCQGIEVKHRILDVTRLGFPHKLFPLSLGFRTQTLKMRFAASEMQGNFLPCPLTDEEILGKIVDNPLRASNAPVSHQAYIGDSFSIIYLPVALQGDDLYDMVTENQLGTINQEDTLREYQQKPEPLNWQPTFLSTICPGCGWNLTGERDSLILFCTNCDSAWEPGDTGFRSTHFNSYFNATENREHLVLPFWEIEAESEGIAINNFADFLRVTNQPKVIRSAWENDPMRFFSPAFKIRPKIYLRLADQLTLAQAGLPAGDPRLTQTPHPVNLPKSEAVQGLKSILASSSISRKNLFPMLPQTKFKIKSISLALLPFRDAGPSFYQDELKINVNKKVLEFGRTL